MTRTRSPSTGNGRGRSVIRRVRRRRHEKEPRIGMHTRSMAPRSPADPDMLRNETERA